MDRQVPNLYENSGYQFERNDRKTITIFTGGGSGTDNKSYTLHEPLTIDRHSDVYIDSFISNSGTLTAANKEVFIMGVDEFNIKHISNDSRYNNKIVIPNTTAADNAATTTAHRATKFNYVGTINPCTLTKLTISLTNNADPPTVVDAGNYWITFVIVARD